MSQTSNNTSEAKKKIIKVAMADDHALFRTGVKISLNKHLNIQLVAEAENGAQLLNLMRHIQPDVVLLDIQMYIMDGIATLAEIKRLYPDVKVIMLSMHNDSSIVARLMYMGANSYLTKEAGSEMIYDAILNVYENGFYANDLTSRAFVGDLHTKRTTKSSMPGDVTLSDKEVTILKLLCDEKDTRQIADIVDLSPRTVEAIREKLKAKTGTNSMAGLVMFAVKAGIIKQEGETDEEKKYEFSKEQIAFFFKLSVSILSYINHDLGGQRTAIFHALSLIKEEIEFPFSKNSASLIVELVEKAFDATKAISTINNTIKSYFNADLSSKSLDFTKQFISRPSQIVEKIKQSSANIKIDIETHYENLEITYPNVILYYIFNELITNAKKHNQKDLEILIKWSVDNKIFSCEFHDNGQGFLGLVPKRRVSRTEINVNENNKESGIGLKLIERTILDSRGHLFFSNSEIKGGAKIYFDFPIIDFADKSATYE